ncbi:MAG: DNA-processing protein DprA [Pseudomonadota bacterium]
MPPAGDGRQPRPEILSDAERIAWLRLTRTDRVGPILFRDLLDHFGSALAAVDALPALTRQGGARQALTVSPADDAEAELVRAAAFGARYVASVEPDYPKHLSTVDAPPPLLAMKGAANVGQANAVAIVGARNCSAAGAKFAARLAAELGAAGFWIVSGLARGIDGAAHRAALETGTLAVFAGGLDRIYPPEHKTLVDQILEAGGTIASERPFGFSARGQDFPRRNRIVSGASLGIVVIEAARRSGTLHTARRGLEQNREIFAAPGGPLDPRSEGANRLIRDGAHLVTEAAHIIEVLNPIAGIRPESPPFFHEPSGAPSPDPRESDRDAVLVALGSTPIEVDELVRFCGLPVRVVQRVLIELDLAERIERRPDQRISLRF